MRLRARDLTGEAQVGLGLGALKQGGKWVSDVRFLANRFALMDANATGLVSDSTFGDAAKIWLPNTVYAKDDIRSYYRAGDNAKSGVYVCKLAHTAGGDPISSPPDNPSYWTRIARYPFIYYNGVTYLDTAVIRDATIDNAKIADATITSAKIANLSAAKIITGDIAVGNQIKSTGFVAGSTGWQITGAGIAEFGAVHIRGKLTGPQIGDQVIGTPHLASQAAMFMVPFSVTGQGGAQANYYSGGGGLDITRRVIAIVQVNIPYTTGLQAGTWYQFSVKVAIDNSVNVIPTRVFSVQANASGQVVATAPMFYGVADLSGANAWASMGARYAYVTLTTQGTNLVTASGTLICQKN